MRGLSFLLFVAALAAAAPVVVERLTPGPADDAVTLTGPAAEAAERVARIERIALAERRVKTANLDVEILSRLVLYRADDLDLAARYSRALAERERAIEARDAAYREAGAPR